ncbi:hypothetical protein ACNQF7_01165 [Flavobacterium sp. RSP29]|uniref:hypothetical protein n=1 Tax=Flavobacterium sp. RSP29 TaxID=3401731 RepID=UPI003AAE1077
MVNIEISANKKSYFLHKEVVKISLKLVGDLDKFESQNNIEFWIDGTCFHFKSSIEVSLIGKKIKGATDIDIPILLTNFIEEKNQLSQFHFSGIIELELIKSLFLIYDSLELLFKSQYDQRIDNFVYNNFIVDNTGKVGVQKEIYFIDKNYLEPTYQPFLDRLLELNLLASLQITSYGNIYNSYYIPLTKPGIGKEEFKSKTDQSGNKTYNLWKKILFDRDNRIRNWINNRY